MIKPLSTPVHRREHPVFAGITLVRRLFLASCRRLTNGFTCCQRASCLLTTELLQSLTLADQRMFSLSSITGMWGGSYTEFDFALPNRTVSIRRKFLTANPTLQRGAYAMP